MPASSVPIDPAALLDRPQYDQRVHRRYPISLHVLYRLRNQGRITVSGTGRTFNISSGGILFQSHDALPAGGEVELLLKWPFLLDGDCPLKLVVQGKIVRSDKGGGTAIQILSHEFRTSKRAIS